MIDAPDSASAKVFMDLLHDARIRVARARRAAIVGGTVGLLVAGVGLGVLVAIDAGTSSGAVTGSDVLWLGLTILAAGFMAAALGHLIGGGRTGRLLIEELGYDTGGDRIKQALAGQPRILTDVELTRASRYAALGAILLPVQITRFVLLFTGVALGQLGGLVNALGSDTDATSIGFAATGLGSAVLAIGLVPAYRVSSRRFRAFSTAHPYPAAPTMPTTPK